MDVKPSVINYRRKSYISYTDDLRKSRIFVENLHYSNNTY